MRKRKVGLALSSGAARGFAHIGVLAALEREGIPIDMIAGTSTGALMGALYAQGRDINEIKRVMIGLGTQRVFYITQLVLAKTRLIRAKKAKNWLQTLIGDIEFKDLKIPFACVATDIITGEEVVINQGSVAEGVRASGSFPVILPPFKWDGRYLVDGGLLNPVPVSVLKEMGADFIIAVNTIIDRSKGLKPVSRTPNILKVMGQAFHISNHRAVTASLIGADVIIRPQVANIRFWQFHRAQEIIQQGEIAAQDSIPEIKRQLGRVNL